MITHELQQPLTSQAVHAGSLYTIPSATSINQMDEIEKTLDSVKTNGIVWIGGDLNLPDINWKDKCVVGKNYPQKISNSFLNKVNDIGLRQINDQPTRGDGILDIFLTNRPNLVTRNSTIPGLGDHLRGKLASGRKPTVLPFVKTTIHFASNLKHTV